MTGLDLGWPCGIHFPAFWGSKAGIRCRLYPGFPVANLITNLPGCWVRIKSLLNWPVMDPHGFWSPPRLVNITTGPKHRVHIHLAHQCRFILGWKCIWLELCVRSPCISKYLIASISFPSAALLLLFHFLSECFPHGLIPWPTRKSM